MGDVRFTSDQMLDIPHERYYHANSGKGYKYKKIEPKAPTIAAAMQIYRKKILKSGKMRRC